MRHFTDIELYRWRESSAGDDRSRIIEHLATCAECAGRYAAAIRNRPLRAEPEANVGDFVATGVRAHRRQRWIVPLAAAILIAVIAIPLEMRRSETTPELHFRGGGIQSFAPEGTVDRNARLVWSTSITAARFRITIGDSSGVIYATDTTQSSLLLPPRLWPGVEYWWTVTALDDRGHALASSPRRMFTIRQ